jgi:hypothetical protein
MTPAKSARACLRSKATYFTSKICRVARLGTQLLRPGDDIEAAARKILRESHGRHSSFYDPIPYGRALN